MISINYSLLAEEAIIDQRTNCLSIFNQIDEINAPNLPAVIPKITMVLLFQSNHATTDILQVNIKLVSPSKKAISIGEAEISFQGKRRTRHCIRMLGLPFEEFGDYSFCAEWMNKSDSQNGNIMIPLEVKQSA